MPRQPRGSSSTRTNVSLSAISPRPRVGSRYNYRASQTTSENNGYESSWSKLKNLGGKQLWCRLVVAFAIISFSGIACIILGAVFLERAREIYKEDGISLPYIWSIIGMVCGSLLIICSIILGKMVLSSKCKTPQRSHCNQVHESPSHSTVTFIPSRRRTESGTVTDNSDLHLGQPPPYDPNRTRSNNTQVLPPTAVFIISQGAVNMAVPALVEHHLSPPKYENLNLVELPDYSETDPLKLPKYDELSRENGHLVNEGTGEDVERQIDSCQSLREDMVRGCEVRREGVENRGFDGISFPEVEQQSLASIENGVNTAGIYTREAEQNLASVENCDNCVQINSGESG